VNKQEAKDKRHHKKLNRELCTKAKLGRKNAEVLLALYLNAKRGTAASQACSRRNVFQKTADGKDRQVIHCQKGATDKTRMSANASLAFKGLNPSGIYI
jgi:hypothetical protein